MSRLSLRTEILHFALFSQYITFKPQYLNLMNFKSFIKLSQSQQIQLETKEDIDLALDFQLKLLQMYGPTLSIYALPSFKDTLVWNAIIFVRNGCYKDGKFKFNIHLHGFPKLQPRVFFTSNLYHPLINESSGQCDVTSLLSDCWNYGANNMLYNLMSDIQKMFTDKERLMNKSSFNPQAAKLFQKDTHQFIIKVMKSVSIYGGSIKQDNSDCSLKIESQIKEQEAVEITKKLEQIVCLQKPIDDKIQLFVRSLLE